MVSDGITIKIKPSLITHSLENVLRNATGGAKSPEEKARLYFALMDAIDQLEKRILKYARIIKEFLMDRGWTREYLEDIGEKILKYAFENASSGYVDVPKGTTPEGTPQPAYQKRESIVEKLYLARIGYIPEGLTAGEDQLLNSLRIGDQNNIFDVRPDAGRVEVGTKWIHAKQIEEGGTDPKRKYRDYAWHLGVSGKPDEGGNPQPAKWLIEAVGESEARRMVDELMQLVLEEKPFPPRPYLKPALWYMVYNKEPILMLIDLLIIGLKRDLGELSGISTHNDEYRIEEIMR